MAASTSPTCAMRRERSSRASARRSPSASAADCPRRSPTTRSSARRTGAGARTRWRSSTRRGREESTRRSTSTRTPRRPRASARRSRPSGRRRAARRRLSRGCATRRERSRILAETARLIREERGGGDPRRVVLASCEWDTSLDGKNLAEVAAKRGLPATIEGAAEAALWIVEQGDCDGIFHAIGEEDLDRILRHPATMVASDGGIYQPGEGVPHPRSYGTFARVLAVYVRERRVLTLEEAVRKMSGFPAARLGLVDRGILRPGMKADLVDLRSGARPRRRDLRESPPILGRLGARPRQRGDRPRKRRRDGGAARPGPLRTGGPEVACAP